MAQFYKELKELRESRGISMDEISDRTKINIKYLHSIESGEFSQIEIPYLRLFLRAYAEEIGGDSNRALEQLDSYLGTSHPISHKNLTTIDEQSDIQEKIGGEPDRSFDTDQKFRKDLIKGGFLLLVFIFSILIFKKIFNKESTTVVPNTRLPGQGNFQSISEQELSSDFLLDQTREELLPVSPPFFIKLRVREQTYYSFKNDTFPAVSNLLQENWEQDLSAFVKTSELLFSNTNGLTLFINGVNITNIANYNNPLRLTISPSPPSMVIQRYKPIQ
jgi:transcriptional regulator with XRE-family HTH domain